MLHRLRTNNPFGFFWFNGKRRPSQRLSFRYVYTLSVHNMKCWASLANVTLSVSLSPQAVHRLSVYDIGTYYSYKKSFCFLVEYLTDRQRIRLLESSVFDHSDRVTLIQQLLDYTYAPEDIRYISSVLCRGTTAACPKNVSVYNSHPKVLVVMQ